MVQERNELKEIFFAGLFSLLPALILVALSSWLYRLLLRVLAPVLAIIGLQQNIFFILLLLFLLILVIFIIGITIRTAIGKQTFKMVEQWMFNLIPGYKQVKKVTQSFQGKQITKNANRVVLVDLFQNGTYTTGFITDNPTKKITTVFIPTGPNPTSGLIYHVQNKYITKTTATPQEAFESIIAVGKNSSILFKDMRGKTKKKPAKKRSKK